MFITHIICILILNIHKYRRLRHYYYYQQNDICYNRIFFRYLKSPFCNATSSNTIRIRSLCLQTNNKSTLKSIYDQYLLDELYNTPLDNDKSYTSGSCSWSRINNNINAMMCLVPLSQCIYLYIKIVWVQYISSHYAPRKIENSTSPRPYAILIRKNILTLPYWEITVQQTATEITISSAKMKISFSIWIAFNCASI